MEYGVLAILGALAVASGSTQTILSCCGWILFLLLCRILLPRERQVFIIALAWGATLSMCGWLGPEVLLVTSLSSMVFLPGERIRSGSLPCRPLFLFGLGVLVSEVLIGLGLYGETSHMFSPRFLAQSYMRSDLIRSFFDVFGNSWQWLFRLGVFSLVVKCFQVKDDRLSGFCQGFWFGGLISSLYIVLQATGGGLNVLSNQSMLWDSLRRISGLASDPNAQGILLGLALWMGVLQKRGYEELSLRKRCFFWVQVVCVCMGGFLTGSRTFFLITGCLGATILTRKSIRSVSFFVFGLFLLVSTVTWMDYLWNIDSILRMSPWLPEGLSRIVKSGSLIRVAETFSSRMIFWKLALSVVRDHWFFGVGPDRFANYVALYGHSFPSLGAWIDNANNFYLGLLAEGGIFAALGFLMLVLGYRFDPSRAPWFGRSVLAMLGIILFFGPHTDFVEVLVPTGLLVGSVTSDRFMVPRMRASIAGVFLLLGILLPHFRELGMYGWEYEKPGQVRRWLGPYAFVHVPCKQTSSANQSNEARLFLRAQYVPSSGPLIVTISSGAESSQIKFFKGESHTATLSCPDGRRYISAKIAASTGWRPSKAWPGSTHDKRVLSVQQIVTY